MLPRQAVRESSYLPSGLRILEDGERNSPAENASWVRLQRENRGLWCPGNIVSKPRTLCNSFDLARSAYRTLLPVTALTSGLQSRYRRSHAIVYPPRMARVRLRCHSHAGERADLDLRG